MLREGEHPFFLGLWATAHITQNRNAGFFIYIDLSQYLALLPDTTTANGSNSIPQRLSVLVAVSIFFDTLSLY